MISSTSIFSEKRYPNNESKVNQRIERHHRFTWKTSYFDEQLIHSYFDDVKLEKYKKKADKTIWFV